MDVSGVFSMLCTCKGWRRGLFPCPSVRRQPQYSSPSLCSVDCISAPSDLESEISTIDEGIVHNPLAATLS